MTRVVTAVLLWKTTENSVSMMQSRVTRQRHVLLLLME